MSILALGAMPKQQKQQQQARFILFAVIRLSGTLRGPETAHNWPTFGRFWVNPAGEVMLYKRRKYVNKTHDNSPWI